MNNKRWLSKLLSSLLLIFVFLSIPVKGATTYPTPTANKYINDYTGVVSESETRSIVSIGKELEDKTGAQSVVVLIDSTNGIPIENYAIDLFRTWGIGQQGKDNGLLILVAVNDKAWRVEVGRGLEGPIPDALSNRVMESIAKPSFIEGNYGQGVLNSYSAFSDYIAGEYNVTLEKSLNIRLPQENTTDTASSLGILILGGIFIVSILADVLFNRGRISSTFLQLMFISSLGRRGPRGGSGGGGGFGGFGGGSSNGGGSSGGW